MIKYIFVHYYAAKFFRVYKRSFFAMVVLFSLHVSSKSQTDASIFAKLNSINKTVTNNSCSTGNGALISNRAMNIFLADKTGYLSESSDLSYYTNYVTLNTAEGKLTVNHNFQEATGIDEPIKTLLSVGVSMHIANSFAPTFLGNNFENELGLTVNYKWLGKTKTSFGACIAVQPAANKKLAMDALRAAIIHSLQIEINKKETDFIAALNAIDTADFMPQNLPAGKEIMKQDFYEDLALEYEEKFAQLQATKLANTNNFKLITTGWTSLTAYLPLLFPKYTVAPSLTANFNQKHSYPLDITLSHTRLWESSRLGRLFITLAGKVLFNNSKLSYGIDKINLTTYKNMGGTDTLRLAELTNDKAYIGLYKTFVTPSIKGRLVYFPGTSHIGISFLMEQNFGSYNLLNGRLGIPVVLMNSKKLPALNLEFYLMFYDMSNKIAAAKKSGGKTFLGLGLGIPFSRLMF